MGNNLIDTSTWSAITFAFIMDLNWGFIVGTTIGIVSAVMRYMEWKEQKRANDLKEEELNINK